MEPIEDPSRRGSRTPKGESGFGLMGILWAGSRSSVARGVLDDAVVHKRNRLAQRTGQAPARTWAEKTPSWRGGSRHHDALWADWTPNRERTSALPITLLFRPCCWHRYRVNRLRRAATIRAVDRQTSMSWNDAGARATTAAASSHRPSSASSIAALWKGAASSGQQSAAARYAWMAFSVSSAARAR